MTESENSSTVPGTEEVIAYRTWLEGQPRAGRGILFVGWFAAFVITGHSVDILQSVLGDLPTQFVVWGIVIFLLYSLYGLLRPSFAYVKGLV